MNGEWRDTAKAPRADSMKRSKAGRLALQYIDGDYRTVRRDSIPPEQNLLQPVFRNGQLLKKWDLSELIERSKREYREHYYRDAVAQIDLEPEDEAVPVGA